MVEGIEQEVRVGGFGGGGWGFPVESVVGIEDCGVGEGWKTEGFALLASC